MDVMANEVAVVLTSCLLMGLCADIEHMLKDTRLKVHCCWAKTAIDAWSLYE